MGHEEAFDANSPISIGSFFQRLFSFDFMPHGHCYYWRPDILWLNVLSDLVIALAYFSIPIILIFFIRKRKDIPFNRIFWMFSAFILLCGCTHLIDIVTVWYPFYRFEGIVKMLTALVSLATAIMLIPIMPKAIKLPGLQQALRSLSKKTDEMEKVNSNLQRFNRLSVDREKRMVELKQEVNELSRALGKEPPYSGVE